MKKIIVVIVCIIVFLPLALLIYRERLPASFSVVVIPDTQKYTERFPDIFCNQTTWIKDHRDEEHIVFASHMGDIVDNGKSNIEEWETASRCMGILDGHVPYSVIPGNHDTDIVNKKDSGFTAYTTYFPASRYQSYDWYKGNYNNNQNSYQLIHTPEIDLLFINLEIEPSDDVLDWAANVVQQYPDVYTIVTTHKYLPDEGTVRDNKLQFSSDGNTGEDIWNTLIEHHCSIKLVLNGHYHEIDGENSYASTNACGDTVYQIVQDYQSRKMGGNGALRIYRFMPLEKKIRISTYSPYTNTYETDSNSAFTIPLVQ